MFRAAAEREGNGGGEGAEEDEGLLLPSTTAITTTTAPNNVAHHPPHSAAHSHPHQCLHHHHRFEPRHQHESSISERQRQLQQQRHLTALAKDPENGLSTAASLQNHFTPAHQQAHSCQPNHHYSHHSLAISSKNKRRHRWFRNCCSAGNTENSNKFGGSNNSLNGTTRLGQPRLVDKEGECIIRPNNLRGSFSICLRNWFHLIIEHSWRRIFLIFAGGFVSSWLGFGFLYYLIQHFSGDLQNLSEQHQCIANVHSLSSAFLFSLESQHTIGYGTRYMTETCPLAYAVLSLQCIVGVLLQTILSGIVIAKILRPKKRKQEMRFSKYAVIGTVDDEDQRPALMIRLADIQHRLYIAESHVRLYMATTKINKRGECELIGVQDMNVGYDTGMDRVLLLWPVVIRHIIDEDSPLWEITEEKLRTCQFELIMTVEGIVEATGMAFQARTSFLPYEILWGRHFTPLITLNPITNRFEVDYELFDVTEPQPVPPWLPEEAEDNNDVPEQQQQDNHREEQSEMRSEVSVPSMANTTKLSVISELDNNNSKGGIRHVPNGYLVEQPPPMPFMALPIAAQLQQQQQQHRQQQHTYRRRSACSIAESIRSAGSAGPGGTNIGTTNRFHTTANMAEDANATVENSRPPAPRKSSRSSLLHLLIRRTQTNDSSPLMASPNGGGNNGAGGEDGMQTEEDDYEGNDVEAGMRAGGGSQTMLHPPASPFVVHTLQHSGFT